MIDRITNHQAQGEARLLEQYKEAINIKAVLEVYAGLVQDFEDTTHAMFSNRMLDEAEGLQLDGLGELVGIAREGLDDDTYRLFILFQIGKNRSVGNAEAVIQLFRLAGKSDSVQLTNEGQGSISLTYSTIDAPENEAFLQEHMPEVVAAGVKISAFIMYEPVTAFAFSGDPNDGLGFSRVADLVLDPALRSGGEFAGTT